MYQRQLDFYINLECAQFDLLPISEVYEYNYISPDLDCHHHHHYHCEDKHKFVYSMRLVHSIIIISYFSAYIFKQIL